MLDPDVDSFLDETVAYSFVDDHPDSRFRYVVDHSRFAVVDFHWHTLLDRSVRFNVYNVADSGPTVSFFFSSFSFSSIFFFIHFFFYFLLDTFHLGYHIRGEGGAGGHRGNFRTPFS